MVIKEIKSSYANVRNNPCCNSILETQLIHGEKLEVLSSQEDWSHIRSEEDNYKGWIKNNLIGNETDKTHKIRKLSTYVFIEPNHKSKVICKLYLNSKIKVNIYDENWFTLIIKDQIGYIHTNSIVDLSENDKNWINICLKFQNAPYLWGGKTFDGIDCSGLIQLSLQYCGIKFPRNTDEQLKFTSEYVCSAKYLSKGVLVFWEGHIGVMVSNNEVLHSNMFHLGVNIEKISTAVSRIGEIKSIKQLKI